MTTPSTVPSPLTAMRARTNRLVAEMTTPTYVASATFRGKPVVAARHAGSEPADGMFAHPQTGAAYRIGEVLDTYEVTCERTGGDATSTTYALEGRPKHHLAVCSACGEQTYERR